MTRKYYWGLATLTVLLISIMSFLFIQQQTEITQLKKTTAQADKLLEENNKAKSQQAELPKDQTPPPGASPQGHWHGDEWHEAPDDPSDIQAEIIETTDTLSHPNPEFQHDKWTIEYQKAHKHWEESRTAFYDYQKGKWTPDYIQSLSKKEKQEIESHLKTLFQTLENAKQKLDTLHEQAQLHLK